MRGFNDKPNGIFAQISLISFIMGKKNETCDVAEFHGLLCDYYLFLFFKEGSFNFIIYSESNCIFKKNIK